MNFDNMSVMGDSYLLLTTDYWLLILYYSLWMLFISNNCVYVFFFK